MPADPQSLFLHGYAEQHPYGSVDASDPFSELHSCFVAGYLSEVQEKLTKQQKHSTDSSTEFIVANVLRVICCCKKKFSQELMLCLSRSHNLPNKLMF